MEIHSLTENPEMRRRREAFLAAELMKERTRSNQMLNGLDLASSSAGSPNGFRSLAALIKQDAGLAKQQGGELQAHLEQLDGRLQEGLHEAARAPTEEDGQQAPAALAAGLVAHRKALAEKRLDEKHDGHPVEDWRTMGAGAIG